MGGKCTDCAQWGCTMNCGPVVQRPRYTSNPSENRKQWFVWDAAKRPADPVFVGTMEQCGTVADVLNSRHEK